MSARYICKKCGAESPTGIGYVVADGQKQFPRPEMGCPNPHKGERPVRTNGLIINLIEPSPFPIEHDGEYLLLITNTKTDQTFSIWLTAEGVREGWEALGAALQTMEVAI